MRLIFTQQTRIRHVSTEIPEVGKRKKGKKINNKRNKKTKERKTAKRNSPMKNGAVNLEAGRASFHTIINIGAAYYQHLLSTPIINTPNTNTYDPHPPCIMGHYGKKTQIK